MVSSTLTKENVLSGDAMVKGKACQLSFVVVFGGAPQLLGGRQSG